MTGSAEKGPAAPSVEPCALVVEDQLMNQKLVEAQLHHLGWCCEIVSTGLQALEAMEERSFEVVLMDWQLDGMDGLETTRQIRAIEAKTRADPVLIVGVTARAMAGAVAEAGGVEGAEAATTALEGARERLRETLAEAGAKDA